MSVDLIALIEEIEAKLAELKAKVFPGPVVASEDPPPDDGGDGSPGSHG